jgi:GNAT superfamily N-acetyltransferase
MIDPPRPAVSADRAALVRMAEQAQDEALGQRGGPQLAQQMQSIDEWAERFERLLDDRQFRILVGAIDGVPLGFALARMDRPEGESAAVDLVVLYTEPAARGVGIAAGLMTAITTWASDQGATGVDAVVLPGNRSAKNFFESFGMKARLIRVHRALADDD